MRTGTLAFAPYATNLTTLPDHHVKRLRELAALCPLDFGFGVYMARAALISVEGPKGYMNECELSPLPENLEKGRPSGVTELFNVYPNPASSILTIEFALGAEDNGTLRILEPTGKVVHSTGLRNLTGKRDVDVSRLSDGLYLLHLRTDQGVARTLTFSVIRP